MDASVTYSNTGQWIYFFGFLIILIKVICIEFYLWHNKKEYNWSYKGFSSLFMVFGPGLRYDRYLKFDWWKVLPLFFYALMFAIVYKKELPFDQCYGYGLIVFLLGFHLIACIKDWKRKRLFKKAMV